MLGSFSDGEDVGADSLRVCAVAAVCRVPCEAYFVADLSGVFLDPRVGRVGQDLAADEASMPPSSISGTLLGVAESESGSYSTIVALPSTVASNRARSGSALPCQGFLHLSNDGARQVSTARLSRP